MFERSYHFVPADRPALFERVGHLGADAYVLDLEDAVAAEAKLNAIEELENWLFHASTSLNIFVRVNGPKHPLAGRETELFKRFPFLGVVFPKIDKAEELNCALEAYAITDEQRVIVLIESITGLRNLSEIAAVRPLYAFGLGLEDFLDTDLFEAEEREAFVQRIRTEIALQARAVGISAIDTISKDLTGGEVLKASVTLARSCGLDAKFTIHPKQVGPINEGFTPSPGSRQRTRRIISVKAGSSAESGYSRIGKEILSPPSNRKARFISKFIEYHDINN